MRVSARNVVVLAYPQNVTPKDASKGIIIYLTNPKPEIPKPSTEKPKTPKP